MIPVTPERDTPEPGTPYPNLRMVETAHVLVSDDGRYGAFITDYGSGDDRTRRIDVYDLTAAPTPHCHVEQNLVSARGEPIPEPRLPTITADGC